MVLSDHAINYFKTVHAKVTAGMVEYERTTPYYLNDPFIHAYETLRAVWHNRIPIKTVCQERKYVRSSYYKIESTFVSHGVIGLFDLFNNVTQLPKLERFVLLVKDARPSLSNQGLLRFSQALLPTAKDTSLTSISQILKSHGLSVCGQNSDKQFFGAIQRRLEELTRCRQKQLCQRDTSKRFETFLLYQRDQCQHQLELLRELFYHKETRASKLISQYGMAPTTFYRLVAAYQEMGPLALICAANPGKGTPSSELQVQTILCKLRYPRYSAENVVRHLSLRCSSHVVNRIFRQWELTDKERTAVALDEYLQPTQPDKRADAPLRSAVHLHSEEKMLQRYRINSHFKSICKKMQYRVYHLCDPGVFLLAPFINDLGVVQAFHSYGPEKARGKDLSHLALLNVFRIIAGYRHVNHLSNNRDRSVALASGIGLFGSISRFYEDTVAFKFDHLHKLRLDLVARAIELKLIDSMALGYDFHFWEFYGSDSSAKGIGKGPDKAGNFVPGFRPHVAWDLANNVIVNMAYFQGGKRAPQVLKNFCEQNIFPVLSPLVIREIYMDSEYTKESDLFYLKKEVCKNGDVYICLKQNKQIKKLIAPALAEDEGWENHDEEDERKQVDVILPHTGLPMRLALLRNRESKKHVRCFGSTDLTLSVVELLRKYRYRWIIENGLKDLVYSYFLDNGYGYDPEKLEFEFYCVMVARLAYEHFLKKLGGKYYAKPDGNKCTLATMRNLLFEKHNCTIHQNGNNDLVVTMLDRSDPKLVQSVMMMLSGLRQQGKNKVLWWGNKGIDLQCSKQFDD